jgi:hypothetical protein
MTPARVHQQVPDVFAAADFAVLSYRRQFSGQSAAVRVAQKYGRPVIASDHGQLGANVGATPQSITVPPELPEELTRAMSYIVGRLGRRGDGEARQALTTASWDLLASKVRSTSRDLISSGS